MTALWLHGFTGAPAAFDGVAAADAFAPWLVGHGSEPTRCEGGGFDDAVDEIAAATAGREPATLVGYSMGARVALRLLVRHPGRFARAVLLGAHPGLVDDAERRQRRAWEDGLRATLASRGLPAFVDDWEALPILRPVRAVPAARLAARRTRRLGHTATGLAHALDVLGLATMPSSWDALERIRVPVTLVVGQDDTKFTAVAQAMRARLAQATVVVVPRCGHDVGLEAPEELARLIHGGDE